MDFYTLLYIAIAGWVVMTLLVALSVYIGWRRGEEPTWIVPMLKFMWKRARFRDVCATVTFLLGAAIGYGVWAFTLNPAYTAACGVGLLVAWIYPIPTTLFYGLVYRYEIRYKGPKSPHKPVGGASLPALPIQQPRSTQSPTRPPSRTSPSQTPPGNPSRPKAPDRDAFDDM